MCMSKLKIVERKNLPETNSSSSHALVIDTGNARMVNLDSPYWDLQIDEKGVIHVPATTKCFGREYDKFNTVSNKILYACGLISYRHVHESLSYLERLKKVVINFTGASDVIFDWIPQYYEEIEKTSLSDIVEHGEYFLSPANPEVDHQSMDLFSEVWETDETLKSFIFNLDSWLYLGSDECDPVKDFYAGDGIDNADAIIHLDFGDEIGKIDIPIQIYPGSIRSAIGKYNSSDILGLIVYDKKAKKFRYRIPGESNKHLLEFDDMFHYSRINYGNSEFCWVSRSFEEEVLKQYTKNLKSGAPKKSEDEIIEDLLKQQPGNIKFMNYTVEYKDLGEILC